MSGDRVPTREEITQLLESGTTTVQDLGPQTRAVYDAMVEEQGRPETTVPTDPSLLQRGGNLAMEGVASVNRAGASLIDIATSPAQYLLQKAGFDIPTLRSTVAEKGDFAGEGLATDVVAGGAELATLGLTGGATTRMLELPLEWVVKSVETLQLVCLEKTLGTLESLQGNFFLLRCGQQQLQLYAI